MIKHFQGIVLFFSILAFPALASAATMVFNDEVYELQYAECNKTSCMNEYVRPTENLENWTDLVTIHLFGSLTAKEYVNHMKTVITGTEGRELMSEIPDANLITFFIMSPYPNDRYIEYNVLFAKDSTDNMAIGVCQFTHKYRFEDEKSFKQAINNCFDDNLKYIKVMSKTDFPSVQIKYYKKEVPKSSKKSKNKS